MKSYSNNKSSKAKSAVLIIVLVLMAAMIAALAASVITGTKPQDWVKKDSPTQLEPTPIKNGDYISLSENVEGLPLYMTRDKAELNIAFEDAKKATSMEDLYVAYLCEKDSVVDGILSEENLNGLIVIMDVPSMQDDSVFEGLNNTGYVILLGYMQGESLIMHVLYDYDTEKFGDVVGEDGRIILSDKDFTVEILCSVDGIENIGNPFFETEAVIFSTTPFVA